MRFVYNGDMKKIPIIGDIVPDKKLGNKVKLRNPKLEGFHLVEDTAGKISNGVYVKDDGSEVIIRFAWGKNLHFRPLKDGETSL